MNLFLKLIASLPILIYFIIIRPTVQIQSWDSESDRFMNTMMMGMGDKIKDAFGNIAKPTFNFSKPTGEGLDGDKPDVANIENSAYNFLTSFVNQTRSTIPLIAHHGNFTLIQAALLFTIGCMAAGAATIVLEGLAFRQRETEIELYKVLTSQHDHHTSGAYGPPPSPGYGVPSSSYGYNQRQDGDSYSNVPTVSIPSLESSPNYYSLSSNSDSDPFSTYYGSSQSTSRKKRDTGQDLADGNFLQLSKPYRRNLYSLPGTGFRPRYQQSSGFGQTGNRNQATFPGASPTYNGVGLISSASQQLTGYPDPNNYLMLNRLGMKRKHYGSQKRRVQNVGDNDEDDEMEYARGIPIELELANEPYQKRIQKRKHKKSRGRDGEEEINGYNVKGEDGIIYNIPQRKRMRKYWKNLARKNVD